MIRLPFAFTEPVRTERLLLRTMTMADVDEIFTYQSREDVCRYLPFEPRDHAEVTAKVAQFSTALELTRDGDYWQLAIERDGHVIGDLYFSIKSAKDATGEIGWTLHPDQFGNGYMTEAASALLDIAFGELALHRVFAQLDPRNGASAALCRRLGMREEAHFVEDLWLKGEWGDTAVYAVLGREWASRSSE